MIVEGIVDVTLYRPLARLGYRDYAAVTETFPLTRPADRRLTIFSPYGRVNLDALNFW